MPLPDRDKEMREILIITAVLILGFAGIMMWMGLR